MARGATSADRAQAAADEIVRRTDGIVARLDPHGPGARELKDTLTDVGEQAVALQDKVAKMAAWGAGVAGFQGGAAEDPALARLAHLLRRTREVDAAVGDDGQVPDEALDVLTAPFPFPLRMGEQEEATLESSGA